MDFKPQFPRHEFWEIRVTSLSISAAAIPRLRLLRLLGPSLLLRPRSAPLVCLPAATGIFKNTCLTMTLPCLKSFQGVS